MKKKAPPDTTTISIEKDRKKKPLLGRPVAGKTRKHSGEITGTIPVIKDVTARHRLNENLQQAHQALERKMRRPHNGPGNHRATAPGDRSAGAGRGSAERAAGV